MEAFRRVAGGYEARLDEADRVLFGHFVVDAVAILASPDEDAEESEITESTDGSENPKNSEAAGAARSDRSARSDTGPESPMDLDGTDLFDVPADIDEEQFRASLDEGIDDHPSEQSILALLDFDPTRDARSAIFDSPVLERVVPPASRGDAEAAAEFRRLTHRDLRNEKATRLMAVLEELDRPRGAGGAVRIPEGQEGLWLAALTDLRLVLGTKLDLETDEDAERVEAVAIGRVAPSAARRAELDEQDAELERLASAVYVALTWWQESLLQSFGGPDR